MRRHVIAIAAGVIVLVAAIIARRSGVIASEMLPPILAAMVTIGVWAVMRRPR